MGTSRGTISKLTVAETLKDALKGQPKLKFNPPPDEMIRRSIGPAER